MRNNTSKYHERSGFKAPENYFESFEDRLISRLEDGKSTRIPDKEQVFTVPQGYFNTLEDNILSKTKKKPRVVSLFRKEYLFYAAAVAAIFVFLLGDFSKTTNAVPLGWDNIEISAMENYIDEGYEMGYFDFNSAEIGEVVFEDGKLIDDSDFKTVTSDAVFDYIDENIEDPVYILE